MNCAENIIKHNQVKMKKPSSIIQGPTWEAIQLITTIVIFQINIVVRAVKYVGKFQP